MNNKLTHFSQSKTEKTLNEWQSSIFNTPVRQLQKAWKIPYWWKIHVYLEYAPKNDMCKNAQKPNQNCLNPFRTTNNLKSKSLRRQQNSNPLISLWQSVMIRYARQVKFIWMPTIWSDASDLQSQASFRGRWQAWYLGTNFSARLARSAFLWYSISPQQLELR